MLQTVSKNSSYFQVAEFAVIASTSSRDANLSLAVLNLWVKRKNYKTYSPLDVVAISLEASAAPCTKSPFSRQVNSKQASIKLSSSCFLFIRIKDYEAVDYFGKAIIGISPELNP